MWIGIGIGIGRTRYGTGGTPTQLLLDQYSGAAAAYSLRLLSSTYTGSAIRVRRSSDNTEQDFNPTEITDGTLENFVGYNLLTFSEDFTNGAWGKYDVSVTADQEIAPNGTLTADRVIFGNVNRQLYRVTRDDSIGEYTFSIYIKGTAGEQIGYGHSQNYVSDRNPFTLDGTWQRLSFTYTKSVEGQYSFIELISSYGDPITIFVWGAQLQKQTTLKPYQKTEGSLYGDGFVKTWYDQSGNGRDASNTTAANQPQIVSSGSVITENGKPTLQFDGTNDFLFTGNVLNVNGLTNLEFFTTVQTTNTSYSGNPSRAIFWMNETGSWGQIHLSLTQTQVAFRLGTGQSGNEQFTNITSSTSMRLISLYKNSTTDRVDINSNNQINYINALSSIANTSNQFNIGRGTSLYMPMNLSELVYYPSDQSSNRTGIETNINAQYNIYWDGSQTSLLDTYSGSAAAYSLRALSSAYTGPLVRVRRASDNAEQDIYAKYDGSLNVDALEAFCASTNGFVKTWYDQSGNGNDATQTTAANQPQIVSSGSYLGFLELNNSDTLLSTTATYTSGTDNTFQVAQATTGRNVFGAFEGTGRYYGVAESGNGNSPHHGNFTNINYYVNTNLLASPTRDDLWNELSVNKSLLTVTLGSEVSDSGVRFGYFSSWTNQKLYEFILYNSDQSSNRSGIESNINNFYNIY